MALSREITLTIDNYNITLDKEIKIYEYDAINLCFTIQECGIVMRDGKAHNRTMPVVALKAYMLIETPQGVDSVEATNIVRNKVIFSLGNKYSQFVGVGKMQIILRDLDGCRITLPEFNYEVKQSINTGWDMPDVLIGEKDFVITDELGRPVETTKISEMDEVNEVTPQTYTVVINEDGNKKIKLDTIMESISETIEFDVERIKGEINEIGESLDNKANLNSIFNMSNMGQDIKEAMTGGSVAVVGINTILTENIVDKQVTAEKIKDVIRDASVNKVDTEKLSDGYLISSGLTGSSSYKTTDYIPVNNGDTVRFYKDVGMGGNSGLRLYNSNLEHLEILKGQDDETSTYTTVTIDRENVAYARFSFQAKNIDKAMLTINADYPISFEVFFDNGYKFAESYKLNNTQKLEVGSIVNSYINSNCLDGKIISFLGDSICYGDGFLGGYGKIIAEQNNMIYENLGKNGSTIASGTVVSSTGSNRGWICRRISEIRSDADYIILEGGVNDGGVGVPIGEVTNGYTATLDDTTFCGALESMFKQAIDRFPGKKIGFIITHRMSESFATFYPKIIEICEKWGIPYCDLFTKCPPLNYIPYLKTNYTKNGDGWHPNELGYKEYYVPKIESWLKTL